MFTGLVQAKGTVESVVARGSGLVLTLHAPGLATADDPFCLGESIAVNGACLTVSAFAAETFTVEVLEETLRCTMFQSLQPGQQVNLERALKVGDRLGGHLVSGHVDEVGILLDRRPEGKDERFRIGCSVSFARGTIRKGSVTVAGTSLTVCAVGHDWFEVALIPTTLRDTILGDFSRGERVNLEADLIGAYVRRALGQEEYSYEQLIAAGFAD